MSFSISNIKLASIQKRKTQILLIIYMELVFTRGYTCKRVDGFLRTIVSDNGYGITLIDRNFVST